jgi:hypothetical protein
MSFVDSLLTNVLHVVAKAALRVQPPLRAHRTVRRIARFMPPLHDVEEAKRAWSALAPRGTCLSRAMTIGARLAGAEVVIGVSSTSARAKHGREVDIAAHAWVEHGGLPLFAREVVGSPIARL